MASENYDRRTLAAFHEAGHAVVAYDQGVGVHGISIVPDEGRMGHISIDTLLLNRLAPTFEQNKRARNRFLMERHVMVLQGGQAAIHKLIPARVDLPQMINREGSDQNIAANLIKTFTSSRTEADMYYHWLNARAEGIMANPMRWFQVKVLAEALMKQEQLGARKVRMIIREAGEEWRWTQGARQPD